MDKSYYDLTGIESLLYYPLSLGGESTVTYIARCGGKKRMDDKRETQGKTIQERMAEEEQVQEKTDAQGRKWKKAYFGGGEHFKNWLAQCKELGEVEVEEVDSTGYKCFEEGGEKLYRIWLRIDASKEDDLF